ncbi:MAG: hypothetical protein ACTSW1_07540 [Candidatus Hodarchaeales archaeon]
MKHTNLNIPKKKDQFGIVSFVHEMTNFQLKVIVKRLYVALQSLATILDKRRPDISRVIDIMLDGNNWNEKMIDDNHVFTLHGGKIIRYNTKDKTFTIMDRNYNELEVLQGHTITDVKRDKSKRRKVA